MHFLNALSIALVSLVAAAGAAPHKGWQPKATNCPLDKAVLPQVTDFQPGAKNLSPPSVANKVPTRVVLGKGTQNYTCAGNTAADMPAAYGAHALLYDVSCLAQYKPELLHKIPDHVYALPENMAEYCSDELSEFVRDNVQVGEHLFTTMTTPVFTFRGGKDIFYGKKMEGVSAPSRAAQGKNGAVDWLKLDSIAGTHGFKEVYRVVTASGKAPATCEGQKPEFEVPYAAEYWFYN
ncbi:malate dehydrogenase [Sphaerosporella brunnea]|uniref:Malate dehydrogenase n=1 Tax=Sphaerosporella brunnea TaxID=1250544 RepID=A0A5J5ETK2_9PEZI|nr:malate dehydrogenase [Sphaerosporella brunnea]